METTRRENSILNKIQDVQAYRKTCRDLHKLLQPYQGKFQDRLPDYVVERFKEITDTDYHGGPNVGNLITRRESKTSKAKVCVLGLEKQIEKYEKILHALDSLDTLPEIDDVLSLNEQIQELCSKRRKILDNIQAKLTVLPDFIAIDDMQDKNMVRGVVSYLTND